MRGKRSWLAAIGALGLVALVTGCVTIASTLPTDAPPSPKVGYVGGLFSKEAVIDFGFRLENQGTKQTYVLEIEDSRVTVIELPPGTYRVRSWLTWSVIHEKITEQEIPLLHPFGHVFEVQAGQVILLGHWQADNDRHFGWNQLRIEPIPTTTADAIQAFQTAYPRFRDEPVTCLACLR